MNIAHMKSRSCKRVLLLLAAGLMYALPGLGQQEFEGIVIYEMTSAAGSPQNITYFSKDNKVRLQMQMPSASAESLAFIIDGNKETMYTLIPQMKMFMEMPAMKGDTSAAGGEHDRSKAVKMGDTQTIAGVKCDHWVITTDQGDSIDLWNAKGFGNFMMPRTMGRIPGQQKPPEWTRELAAQGFFPLKMILKDQEGKIRMQMQATRIERKPLNDTLFEVPPDYSKMNLKGMGNPH